MPVTGGNPTKSLVAVNYRQTGISSTTYLMLIDINNAGGSGPYKHGVDAGGIKLYGFHGTMLKSIVNDSWRVFVGAILSIDGTSAVIGWVRPGSIGLQTTGDAQIVETVLQYPVPVDFTVNNGDYTNIATSFKETVTAVNTGVLINDVSGTGRTPAVGDLLLRVEKVSGLGNVLIHYFSWYNVE